MQFDKLQPNKVYPRLIVNQKRVNLLRGGTRSGKTRSMIQLLIKWLYTGQMGKAHVPKGTFYVIRQTFPALKMTVLKEFIEVAVDIGFYPFINYMKSTHLMSFDGRYIQWMPADDPEKLKGLDPAGAWINEGNTVKKDTFDQVVLRLTGHVYIDDNPSDPDSWIKS